MIIMGFLPGMMAFFAGYAVDFERPAPSMATPLRRITDVDTKISQKNLVVLDLGLSLP
jgi:hypothetical protein